ncbi:MAG: hypothetical protein FJZ01_23455 [Candidatus Sericytochromatia bacterium]|nr:hypothetical protein [Candidatus Tanganyikabacteria bacterium]
MTRDELLRQLADWIGDITDAAPPEVAADTHLQKDLGLDSLALAELAAKLRMRYKVRLRPGELVSDLRAGAVADFVLARLPQ